MWHTLIAHNIIHFFFHLPYRFKLEKAVFWFLFLTNKNDSVLVELEAPFFNFYIKHCKAQLRRRGFWILKLRSICEGENWGRSTTEERSREKERVRCGEENVEAHWRKRNVIGGEEELAGEEEEFTSGRRTLYWRSTLQQVSRIETFSLN